MAQNGYVLSERLASLFKNYEANLSKYAESKRIFLNNGSYYEEGDLFKQPDLAQTLGRMQVLGAREFYTGRTAQLIAADMKANNGLITLQDLRNYQRRSALTLRNFRGYEVITMPPPRSGGS